MVVIHPTSPMKCLTGTNSPGIYNPPANFKFMHKDSKQLLNFDFTFVPRPCEPCSDLTLMFV